MKYEKNLLGINHDATSNNLVKKVQENKKSVDKPIAANVTEVDNSKVIKSHLDDLAKYVSNCFNLRRKKVISMEIGEGRTIYRAG